MKRCLIAAFGLFTLVAAMPANAADLPRGGVPYRAPAYVSGFNWTGFYLGANGGGAFGDSDWNALLVNNSPTGGMLGITGGYNWQGAGMPWVFGVEGDLDWAFLSDSVACAAATTCQTKSNFFGTLRGRAGYAFDRIMPYLTGGLAVGNIVANRSSFIGSSDTNAGWTIGVGVEAAVWQNWTAKVEYLYADLGNITCSTAACGTLTNVDLSMNVLRGGVNYHF
jgi:outer membrane immunogenic protein